MAPKRNTIKATSKPKITPVKITKKKIIKEKPKLKTPTVIKVKIPKNPAKDNNLNAVSSNSNNIEGTPEKFSRKKISAQQRLELANEVIRAQFVKKQPLELPVPNGTPAVPNEKPATVTEVKVSKRQGRSKKVVENSVNTSAIVTDGSKSEAALEKKPRRKLVRKLPVNLMEKKSEEQTEKASDTSTTDDNSAKKSMKQTNLKDLKTDITRVRNVKQNTTKGQMIKQLQTKARIVRKTTGRGKKNTVNKTPISEHAQNENTDNNDKNIDDQPSRKSAEIINSRKTSMTSTSECLSWTKDISSSSTITCLTVCSTDFCIPGEDSVDSYSLNLSTSSISQIKPTQDVCLNDKTESVSKINKVLDKLTSNLKKIDLEILNWIGYQNEDMDADAKKAQERMFQILKEENDVIMHCQQIKQVLNENVEQENTITDIDPKATEDPTENDSNFLKPSNVNFIKTTSNLKKKSNTPVTDKFVDKEGSSNGNKSVDNDYNNFTTDDVPYIPFDHSYDDDDALSLFAESITGIESSRRNSSVGSPPHKNMTEFEEYIPEPITKECFAPEKLVYNPTKILDSDNSVQNVKAKTICEKQNADSTSLYRESEQNIANNCKSAKTQASPNLVNKPFSPNVANIAIPKEKNGSFLMSSVYKPSYGVKSIVFKGICFFHLISSCRNSTQCRFPHVIPDPKEIKTQLHSLSEEMFIQEYMMMRNWPGLRRLYGLCIVEECARRELTSFLVEMALDFITKANPASRNDVVLKVEVVEFTLMYLNSVDLDTCENLLKYNLRQDTVLCDVFMQIIAVTQNFSRFKSVFLKLTSFIIKNGRSFSLNVANQILERVCILPYEEPLARALIDILKHTDQEIFENSMLAKFEQQLLLLNRPLYDQLMVLRIKPVNRPVLSNLYVSSPLVMHDLETITYPEREKRYTSPDTTHLDNLNKTAEEPVIKRTINFDASKSFSINAQYSTSQSSNDNIDEVRSKPNTDFRSWRDKKIFNNIRSFTPSSVRPHRPPPKRPMNRQVSYGGSPSKFTRRTGPNYF
ncbi:uncharacterized protein ACR2FA_006462 [Aphomia sociella]